MSKYSKSFELYLSTSLTLTPSVLINKSNILYMQRNEVYLQTHQLKCKKWMERLNCQQRVIFPDE